MDLFTIFILHLPNRLRYILKMEEGEHGVMLVI